MYNSAVLNIFYYNPYGCLFITKNERYYNESNKSENERTSIRERKVVAGAQLNQVHRGQVLTASVVSKNT